VCVAPQHLSTFVSWVSWVIFVRLVRLVRRCGQTAWSASDFVFAWRAHVTVVSGPHANPGEDPLAVLAARALAVSLVPVLARPVRARACLAVVCCPALAVKPDGALPLLVCVNGHGASFSLPSGWAQALWCFPVEVPLARAANARAPHVGPHVGPHVRGGSTWTRFTDGSHVPHAAAVTVVVRSNIGGTDADAARLHKTEETVAVLVNGASDGGEYWRVAPWLVGLACCC
jgi:hypothetical protein